MLAVRDICQWIDGLAPFDTQAEFDNSGLLLGQPDQPVRGVFFALDASQAVLDEMAETDANLLITHHPLMFGGRKQLTETDCEGRILCRMIRSKYSMIAAHTNLDAATGGINDALAGCCGLIHVHGEGYYRTGELAKPCSFGEFCRHVSQRLECTVRIMSQLPDDAPISQVTVSSGAGSEFWQQALSDGSQVFLTGEMKHHHALAAADAGLGVLEAGHFATEQPGIFALAQRLWTHLNGIGEQIPIYRSQAGAYALPADMIQ